MTIKWVIIRWHLRQTGWFNLAIGALVAFYALMRSEPFARSIPAWFPPLHSALIAWFLGRSTTPSAGYLHVQGFSRDVLWWHGVLSAFGCALWTWLPAALLLLTPIRSIWQDLLQNPAFPYMAATEHRFVWISLWEYAVFVPLWMYVAARWAHPARGNGSGVIIALMLTVLFLVAVENARLSAPNVSIAQRWPLFCGGLAIALTAVLLGRQLAREVEVQP